MLTRAEQSEAATQPARPITGPLRFHLRQRPSRERGKWVIVHCRQRRPFRLAGKTVDEVYERDGPC